MGPISLSRPVAVAVGGGGVLGAAHVSAGYALEQRGFVPDLIAGDRLDIGGPGLYRAAAESTEVER
ncbi:hypothetical protein [Paractinoplanes hotanensis]|uniref:Uncharacterized protein n=1 Tax=Paractinoplanes hotanensis TaxID=2906497 RepID=A0ABT0XS61_9ACTN|nr:hypothetical protein [Actinoplanes hotanensis]MCM4076445.1 hypothetical protein [Actinoplanes hotanensis]